MRARLALMLACLFVFAGAMRAQSYSPSAPASSALSIPLADQITPAQLKDALAGPLEAQPLILHVGSHDLYDQAHIAYATYAGSGADPAGLEMLAGAVAPIPKDHFLVIYCGCCPWVACPNIGPAYHKLRDLGFTNVKALYLATSFNDDWVAKGLPTEHSR